MRTFRLWPDRTSVAVEWRWQGFRIRTLSFLWFVGCLIVGGVMLRLWIPAGVFVLVAGGFLLLFFMGYVYRNDPKLHIREATMLRLIRTGSKHRQWTNERVE